MTTSPRVSRGVRLFPAACAVLAGLAALAAPSLAQQPPRLVLVDDATELEQALNAKTPPRDVPVRLATFSLPGDDAASVKLLVIAEVDQRDQGAAAAASMSYLLTTEKGQRVARVLRRGDLQRLPSGALIFREEIPLPFGNYRLKLGALRNGRVGVAEATVVARVQAAGALRVGDPIVGEVAGEDAVLEVTPDRRLRADRLVVTLPIVLDPSAAAPPTMAVDVAKDANGPPIVSSPMTLLAGNAKTRYGQAVADLRVLPAGDYLARVVVSQAGKELARVSAPFTVEAPASASAGTAAPAVPGRPGTAPTAAPVGSTAFRLEELLDPVVLKPFLDDLAVRAPDRSRAAIERAKAGQLADALKAAPANDPKDPTRPFLLGLSLLSQRQLQQASDAFRETLRASPDYFVGAFYIGVCYAAGGRDPQAVNAWQTSLISLDTYPVVFKVLAEAQSRMGQPDKALDTLEEAAGKWPTDTDLRVRMARAALDGRKYDRVTEIVEAALSRPPADPELLFTAMQALFERATRVGSGGGAAPADTLARMKRYREAYAAAGGTRTTLVDQWLATIAK